MLHIETADYTPGTYIRQSDLEPTVKRDRCTLYAGRGASRSWGTPRAESQVILNTRDQASILCGWNTKHSRGQCWFHIVRTAPGTWTRKTWAQLTDRQRQRILDAPRPLWANVPGKLSSERRTLADTACEALKVVRVEAGGYVSLYDSATAYTLGRTLCQKVEEEHGGGYYAHLLDDTAIETALRAGSLVAKNLVDAGEYAILAVELKGRQIHYGAHKVAATYLTPVREVRRFVVSS